MPVARNIFPCQNLISCFQDIFIVSILGGVINMLRKEKLREISKKLSKDYDILKVISWKECKEIILYLLFVIIYLCM